MSDRRQFLLSPAMTVAAVPLLGAAAPSGIDRLALVVADGGVHVGFEPDSGEIVIGGGRSGRFFLPRPAAHQLRWDEASPPTVAPRASAQRLGDVSFGATLDEVTAGARVKGGVVLAATMERGFSYLVFVESGSPRLRNRSLGWGGPVIAAFPQPDGLHLVRPGGEIVTVELPPTAS